jgi:adenine-specific DNA-methyltransferase
VYARDGIAFSGMIGEINENDETYPCIKQTNARGIRLIKKGTMCKYREKNFTLEANTRVSAGNMELIYLDDLIVKNGITQEDVRVDSNWIYGQDKLNQFSDNNQLYITQDLYIRRIVTDERTKKLKDLLLRVGADNQALPNFKFDSNMNNGGWGTNEDANDELHHLLGTQNLFDFTKPSRLLAKLIQSVSSSDGDIVLDFFSGSATTADAVMQLSAADGVKRKYIMVQLIEPCADETEAAKAGYKNICEIGKERIRRAGDKIKAEAGLTAQNLDIGFRVLKLDDTNMNDVYYAAGDYTQDLILQMESNIKPDRTDLDLLYGCLLDWGLPLSMPHTHEKIDGFTIHTYNDGDLIACFEERISEKAIREIASRKPLRAVFRDSSFNSSPEKINVFEIFKLLAPNTNVRVI